MGTRAKNLAERESISLDFTYGAIDKSILRALVGESSLLLTPGSMVPHVFRRVGRVLPGRAAIPSRWSPWTLRTLPQTRPGE